MMTDIKFICRVLMNSMVTQFCLLASSYLSDWNVLYILHWQFNLPLTKIWVNFHEVCNCSCLGRGISHCVRAFLILLASWFSFCAYSNGITQHHVLYSSRYLKDQRNWLTQTLFQVGKTLFLEHRLQSIPLQVCSGYSFLDMLWLHDTIAV